MISIDKKDRTVESRVQDFPQKKEANKREERVVNQAP